MVDYNHEGTQPTKKTRWEKDKIDNIILELRDRSPPRLRPEVLIGVYQGDFVVNRMFI